MNIFFTASVHSDESLKKRYLALSKLIEKKGHKLNISHVLSSEKEPFKSSDPGLNFKRVISDMKKADAVIAESTQSSISVGYFISKAVELGKPLVVLYGGKEDEEPHLLGSLEENNEKVQVIRYKQFEQLEKEINLIIDFITSSQDTRFNFFVSADLSSYLNWISKTKKIPRSVYLRDLIEAEMKNFEDFLDNSP